MPGRKMAMDDESAEGEGGGVDGFMSALEKAPETVDNPQEELAEGESPLDPEQLDLAEKMGLDKSEAVYLRRFIESVR